MGDTKRISKQISGDLKKLKAVMVRLNDSRTAYKRFMANPEKTLTEAGIDLKGYGVNRKVTAALAKEIAAHVKLQIDKNYWAVFGRIISVMETTPNSSTESGCTKNFDRSSQTDYRYESMTGTEAGQACEKTSGTYTGSSTRFDHSGISFETFDEIFQGPMISSRAMNYIVNNAAKAMKEAQIMR
ncbi:MAG: hypothetical protein ABFD63_10910 [Smithella sp.]|jgi:hypothetical protein